jgi:hypothetical protein
MGTFTDQQSSNLSFNQGSMMVPMFRGATLNYIPFVFINTKDIVANPDEAPLLGLAKTCLAIYRGEADYRQALHVQGQDTLVVIGGTRSPDGTPGDDADAIRVGAGSRIDCDIQGDAKFIGVSSSGLPEMRTSLENDRKDAQSRAGKLVPSKNDAESGEALKTRVSAQTATLNELAWTAAKGLENLLNSIAEWVGAPKTAKVIPNLDFGDFELGTKDLIDLMTARQLGAPISRESIHAIMVDRGMTRMKFEDELAKIEEEDATTPPPGSPGDEEERLKIRNKNTPPEPAVEE